MRPRPRLQRLIAVAAALLLVGALGCGKKTGELTPPSDAAPWASKYRKIFDDTYTRQPVNLSGRAPHDVLDQRLTSARLGFADIVVLVTVEQVWGKGRYQGRQDQYLDVAIDEVLLGELSRDTADQQLIPVRSTTELPGTLQGQEMILFLRWAPGQSPPYHHHLMPADEDTVTWIRAMIDHAKEAGVLDDSGKERWRSRRKRRQSD